VKVSGVMAAVRRPAKASSTAFALQGAANGAACFLRNDLSAASRARVRGLRHACAAVDKSPSPSTQIWTLRALER